MFSKSGVVAVIPARGGSKRLPRKNICPLLGKPMIFYAIRACLTSRFIDRVFVSTEDSEIKGVSQECGAEIIDRPQILAEDNVWVQDVMRHAVQALGDVGIEFDVVVRVFANSPMVQAEKIDEAISKLIRHNLFEVFSVDQSGIEDCAVRVYKKKVVFQNALSVYEAVVITDYKEIHTKEDLKKVEKLMTERSRNENTGWK